MESDAEIIGPIVTDIYAGNCWRAHLEFWNLLQSCDQAQQIKYKEAADGEVVTCVLCCSSPDMPASPEKYTVWLRSLRGLSCTVKGWSPVFTQWGDMSTLLHVQHIIHSVYSLLCCNDGPQEVERVVQWSEGWWFDPRLLQSAFPKASLDKILNPKWLLTAVLTVYEWCVI